MLKSISKYITSESVVRRLVFATLQLPKNLPDFWNVVISFATCGKESSLTADQAKVIVENMQELDSSAFTSDRKLRQELYEFQIPKSKPLGHILISSNEKCLQCGAKLLLRKDRSALLIIYDDELGTIPGTHFHKNCTNPACGLRQYYGYYIAGGSVTFNPDWEDLPYFVSSQETAFSLKLLQRFNAEIVFGQMSFKQCADVYNFLHNGQQALTLTFDPQ